MLNLHPYRTIKKLRRIVESYQRLVASLQKANATAVELVTTLNKVNELKDQRIAQLEARLNTSTTVESVASAKFLN